MRDCKVSGLKRPEILSHLGIIRYIQLLHRYSRENAKSEPVIPGHFENKTQGHNEEA